MLKLCFLLLFFSSNWLNTANGMISNFKYDEVSSNLTWIADYHRSAYFRIVLQIQPKPANLNYILELETPSKRERKLYKQHIPRFPPGRKINFFAEEYRKNMRTMLSSAETYYVTDPPTPMISQENLVSRCDGNKCVYSLRSIERLKDIETTVYVVLNKKQGTCNATDKVLLSIDETVGCNEIISAVHLHDDNVKEVSAHLNEDIGHVVMFIVKNSAFGKEKFSELLVCKPSEEDYKVTVVLVLLAILGVTLLVCLSLVIILIFKTAKDRFYRKKAYFESVTCISQNKEILQWK